MTRRERAALAAASVLLAVVAWTVVNLPGCVATAWHDLWWAL